MKPATVARPLVVALVLALVAVPTPATAMGINVDTFIGTVTLSRGTAAPCLPPLRDPTSLPPWSKGTKTCPPGVNVCTGGIPNCLTKNAGKLIDVNGNTLDGMLSSTICVSQGTNINKPGPPAGQGPGTCSTSASFVYTGYCGLAQIQGSGSETSIGLLGVMTRTFTFSGHNTGGALVIRGNWRSVNGDTGDVIGTLNLIPTVPIHENSCLDKTARTFTMIGTMAFVNPKVLP